MSKRTQAIAEVDDVEKALRKAAKRAAKEAAAALETEEVDEEEAKAQRKAAKRAKQAKEAAAALETEEVDEEEAKTQRKAAKRAKQAKEAAAALETEEVDEEEAKAQRKAAKRAKQAKEAAAALEIGEVDEKEANTQRKAAKKAKKVADAAQEAPELEVDDAEAKRLRKAARKAEKAVAEVAEEEVDEDAAKRQRKAARKAAKEAAAAATPASEQAIQQQANSDDVGPAATAEDHGYLRADGDDAYVADEPRVHTLIAQRLQAKRARDFQLADSLRETLLSECGVEVFDRSGYWKVVAKQKRAAPSASDARVKQAARPRVKQVSEEAKAMVEGSGDIEETILKVFIKGLPYSIDEDSLRNHFAEAGEIESLQMPMEGGRPKGFAFITYATRDGVNAALQFDNTDYGGRYIGVSLATGTSGKGQGRGENGHPGDWNCPSCGDLQFARNSECRQCGAAKPGGGAVTAVGEKHNENTVFVRGLPFSTSEEQLQADFEECGEIEEFRLPKDEKGYQKGYCFIKYKTEAGVEAALKFDNTEYGGRTLNVLKSSVAGKGSMGAKGRGKQGKGKAPDWNCPNCNDLVFGRNSECRSCGAARPGGGADGNDGQGADDDDDGNAGKGNSKSKGKGKGKGKKGKEPSASFARSTGCIIASSGGEKKTFDDSDDE